MKLYKQIVLALIFFPAFAQAGESSINIADTTGLSILSITPGVGEDKGFSLSISGFEIGFNTPKEKHEILDPILPGIRIKNAAQRYRTSLPLIEFGFSAFPNSGYMVHTPNREGFMKHRWSKSTHIQWNVLRFSESFNQQNTIGFNSSLGLAWDSYSFDNYIMEQTNNTRPIGAVYPIGKSRIRTFSLNIPLVLGYNYKSLRLGIGIYGNFVLSSNKKIILHPTFRETIKPYVNKPQAGATLRIKLKGVSLFANYALTRLFEAGTAPNANPITFGIGIW